MTRDFKGQCVLITGAASGIGRETAFEFAEAGATLELVDVDAAGLERTGFLARYLNVPVKTHVVDVSSASAMENLANDVHARHPAVDVLFNNAGVGCAGSFVATDLATWDWAYSVNVKGAIHGCHFFVPKMIARGRGGHVMNMASSAAFAAAKNVSVYAMTKFAVMGMSEALKEELAPHGIRVSTICPGIIDTPITAKARLSADLANDPKYREQSERFYRRRGYGPERVAKVIVEAAQKGGGVVPISPEAWFMYLGKRYAPGLVRKVINADAPQ